MKLAGFILTILAVVAFYGIFWIMTPAIVATLPQGEWHSFLKLVIYILVALMGGIEVPFFLLALGIVFLIED